jgi:hypothetical protein
MFCAGLRRSFCKATKAAGADTPVAMHACLIADWCGRTLEHGFQLYLLS